MSSFLIYIATGPENPRGVTGDDGVELAPPARLVALIAESDRVVSY